MNKSTAMSATMWAVIGGSIGTLAVSFLSSEQVSKVASKTDVLVVIVGCVTSGLAAFLGALRRGNAAATPPTPSNNGQSLN